MELEARPLELGGFLARPCDGSNLETVERPGGAVRCRYLAISTGVGSVGRAWRMLEAL